ncbi:MAG: lysophospholipid acyltransferase family protein [Deltaproteobacteria bacterium]|nr:lysophospholipid acyltransferase family protein [Deltaproteobacteria bacterium]
MLVRFLLAASRLLPRPLLAAAGMTLSVLVFGVLGVRRALVREALARSLPGRGEDERRRIERAFHRHLGRALAELLWGITAPLAALREQIVLDGFEALEEAAASGRGAIVATAHFGSWELCAVAAARLGLPLAVVSKRLRVGWLDRSWAGLRARIGLAELPVKGSTRAILRHLRGGGVLGLVIDQHLPPPGGVAVPFLGREAFTTRAPVVLHRRSGAPIFTVYLVREGPWRHRMVVRPFEVGEGEAEVAVLERLNATLEARIEAAPEQWLWLHRRWKQPPEKGSPG